MRSLSTLSENKGGQTNDINNDAIGADKGIEGTYASALFNVAKANNKLDLVYSNFANLEEALKSSPAMKSILLSAHFKIPESSQKTFIETFKVDFDWDPLSTNFIELLIANKRFYMIESIFKSFEKLYRSQKGIKHCLITSSKDLSSSQKNDVLQVLQKRVGDNFKLLADFNSNPSLLGGIMVTLDEQVLDFSVSSRLERIQNELLEPITQ